MKTVFKVSVVVLLLLALSAGVLLAFQAANNREELDKGEPVLRFIKPDNDNAYFIKTYADGSPCKEDFKIITFADPHFNGVSIMAGDATSLTLIENTIKQEKPDLIVICGDIAVGANAVQGVRNLGELFKKYNQYWGYALGNHDAENEHGPDRAALTEIYAEFEHCVVSSAPDISGEGNCIVNVKNAYGEVIQSLVFIDSGNYLTPEKCQEHGFPNASGYDFIKFDQIQWYKSEMLDIARKNGRMPNSIMFIHIPLKEYRTAYNEAVINGTVIYGARREPECDSPYNSGMFDAILEIGSTKSVVCGHDHTSDYCVDYKGVKLLYSQSTSFNSYYMRKNIAFVAMYQLGAEVPFSDGHTLFLVQNDGKQTIIPKLNQDSPSLFDGLTDEQRDAIFLDKTLPQ